MEEIFNRLIAAELMPNTYYMLFCLKEKVIPNKFINKELELSRLQANDWVTQDLVLTAKSLIFIEEINSFFKKTKKKTISALMGDSYMEKINLYLEVFPNRKLNSGKPARVNAKNLEAPFKWFFETYDYDWETILQATEKYVSEYELKRFEYMRNSQYFIRKQNLDKSFESDLATYCELVASGADEVPTYFRDNIV
jgi:hypothetical protein